MISCRNYALLVCIVWTLPYSMTSQLPEANQQSEMEDYPVWKCLERKSFVVNFDSNIIDCGPRLLMMDSMALVTAILDGVPYNVSRNERLAKLRLSNIENYAKLMKTIISMRRNRTDTEHWKREYRAALRVLFREQYARLKQMEVGLSEQWEHKYNMKRRHNQRKWDSDKYRKIARDLRYNGTWSVTLAFRKVMDEVNGAVAIANQVERDILDHRWFCDRLARERGTHSACRRSTYRMSRKRLKYIKRNFDVQRLLADVEFGSAKRTLAEVKELKSLDDAHRSKVANLTKHWQKEAHVNKRLRDIQHQTRDVASNVSRTNQILATPEGSLLKTKKLLLELETRLDEWVTVDGYIRNGSSAVAQALRDMDFARSAWRGIKDSRKYIKPRTAAIKDNIPYLRKMAAAVEEQAFIVEEYAYRRIKIIRYPLLWGQSYVDVLHRLDNTTNEINNLTETTKGLEDTIQAFEKIIRKAIRKTDTMHSEEDVHWLRTVVTRPGDVMLGDQVPRARSGQGVKMPRPGARWRLKRRFRTKQGFEIPRAISWWDDIFKKEEEEEETTTISTTTETPAVTTTVPVIHDYDYDDTDEEKTEPPTTPTPKADDNGDYYDYDYDKIDLEETEATEPPVSTTSKWDENGDYYDYEYEETEDGPPETEILPERTTTEELTTTAQLRETTTVEAATEATTRTTPRPEPDNNGDYYDYDYDYHYDEKSERTTQKPPRADRQEMTSAAMTPIATTKRTPILGPYGEFYDEYGDYYYYDFTKLNKTSSTTSPDVTTTPARIPPPGGGDDYYYYGGEDSFEDSVEVEVLQPSTPTPEPWPRQTTTAAPTTVTAGGPRITTDGRSIHEKNRDDAFYYYYEVDEESESLRPDESVTYESTDDEGSGSVEAELISTTTRRTRPRTTEVTSTLPPTTTTTTTTTTTPAPLSPIAKLIRRLRRGVNAARGRSFALRFKALNRTQSFHEPRRNLVQAKHDVRTHVRGLWFVRNKTSTLMPLPEASNITRRLSDVVELTAAIQMVVRSSRHKYRHYKRTVNDTLERLSEIPRMAAHITQPMALEEVGKSWREVTGLDSEMWKNHTRIKDSSDSIRQQIDSLREKVLLAKNTINFLQPSFNVTGRASPTYRLPFTQQDTSLVNTLHVDVMASSPAAAFVTLTDFTRKQRLEYPHGRQVQIGLKRGNPFVEWSDERIVHRLSTSRPLNDGQWHRITLKRTGRLLEMTEAPRFAGVNDTWERDYITLPPGDMTQPFPAYLVIGGNSTFMSKLKRPLRHKPRACMTNVVISGAIVRHKMVPRNATSRQCQTLDDLLWMNKDSSNQIRQRRMWCISRYHNREYIDKQLNKDGSHHNTIAFSFRTKQDEATLLFYQSYPRDVFQLAVYHQSLLAEGRIDGRAFRHFCRDILPSDGEWHHAVFDLKNTSSTFSVDGKECFALNFALIQQWAQIPAVSVYVLPHRVQMKTTSQLPSQRIMPTLQGDITNYIFNNRRLLLHDRECQTRDIRAR